MADVFVKVFVDVLAALYEDSLHGNVFGFDTNVPYGSVGNGTSSLGTAVQPGDHVYWRAVPLECEATVQIEAVDFAGGDIKAELHDSNGFSYWSATVSDIPATTAYSLRLGIGRHGKVLEFNDRFTLRPMEVHHD
jgi:hypothetical protein